MKTYCFDLDGVICTPTDGDYDAAKPHEDVIALINRLYDRGDRVVIYTSRFMGRTNQDVLRSYQEGYSCTERQLQSWGVRFHQLFMGKPRYDVLIDDRALFFRPDWIGAIE